LEEKNVEGTHIPFIANISHYFPLTGIWTLIGYLIASSSSGACTGRRSESHRWSRWQYQRGLGQAFGDVDVDQDRLTGDQSCRRRIQGRAGGAAVAELGGGMGPLNTGYNRQYSNAVAASLQRKSSSSSIQLGGRFCSAIFRFAYVAVQSSKPTHARQRGCGDEVESRRRNRCQRGHDSRRLGRDYEVQLWRATTMMDRGSQASRVVPFLLMFLLHLKPLLALFPKFISTIKHISNK
jgi:hypothetical protein